MQDDIVIVNNNISKSDLKRLAEKRFGDLVKAVVDIDLEIMAIGGELHADEEAVLLERGSKQKNLWGINIYPNEQADKMIEFDSMINIRPSQNNKSRTVENEEIQKNISKIVSKLISD